MGGLATCLTPCIPKPDPIVLLLLGLDNSGKTSVSLRLQRDLTPDTRTSWGFTVSNVHSFPSPKSKQKLPPTKLYDLGGHAKIRNIWQNYFADCHGIIYVLDSTDKSRLEEMKSVFWTTANDDRIKNKPILILLTKTDNQNTTPLEEIIKQLDFPTPYDEASTNIKFLPCVANLHFTDDDPNYGVDKNIVQGIHWVVGQVLKDFKKLSERVKSDQQVQALKYKREQEEKRRRVEEYRKERQLAIEKSKAMEESPASSPTTDTDKKESPKPEMAQINTTKPILTIPPPPIVSPLKKFFTRKESVDSTDEHAVPVGTKKRDSGWFSKRSGRIFPSLGSPSSSKKSPALYSPVSTVEDD